MASDTDLLESTIAKTAGLIEAVRAEQLPLPTPCPDYDVAQLVDHLIGWLRLFAARAEGSSYVEDPYAYRTGGEPAEEFAEAGRRAVAAFRAGAVERSFPLTGESATPGSMVLAMMLGEFVGHGWDLATATSQPVPFTDAEAEAALGGLRGILRPEYRGADKTFGDEVPAPADASALDRFVGFIGRDPRAYA
ncbi:MAG: hypothetical protein JWM93_2532 [Frankiales bacterium]|nr:hypothetical protein [Frankiales bacterium]